MTVLGHSQLFVLIMNMWGFYFSVVFLKVPVRSLQWFLLYSGENNNAGLASPSTARSI